MITHTSSKPDISIIIVNYNVEDLLKGCLQSIASSTGDLRIQTIVIDNASSDKSVEMVGKCFPWCHVIPSKTNLGFSKANNAGLKLANGEYVLLLNPDTVLDQDVLVKMARFMDKYPDVGLATCKLITKDGRLDLACRRNFPSPWDGFCRASGLSSLFPKSRLFAGYNMTYLDENQTYPVPAVNGAFMFVRSKALEEVGFLDEDYFIYVEDLDWCYRFQQTGWKTIYYPETTALHLKGQSGKKVSSAMIRRLFESTEIFYRKHYFPNSNLFTRLTTLTSLQSWKYFTLLKNRLRKEKQTRP